jgi:hypothetical protein
MAFSNIGTLSSNWTTAERRSLIERDAGKAKAPVMAAEASFFTLGIDLGGRAVSVYPPT